jgi:hypothetical protein
MPDSPNLAGFIKLSHVLTNQKKLDKKIAAEYLNRLEVQYQPAMQALIDEFNKINAREEYLVFEVKRKIADNPVFFPMVLKIIKIWYTSQINPIKVKGVELDNLAVDEGKDSLLRTKPQYDNSIIWQLGHSHPPGDGKKRKPGHWHKAPKINKS